jgi:xylulokinase
MVADSTGVPVIRSLSSEASALGAGMTAAVGAGWYADFTQATRSMTRIAEQIDPSPANFSTWQQLAHRQAKVHERMSAMIDSQNRSSGS